MRIAKKSDLPQIVAIYNSTIASGIATADTAPVSVEDRLPWFQAHHAATRPILVHEVEGKVVAWVSFSNFYGRPAYQGTAEISIYLDPATRGQGMGKQLLQEGIEICPQIKVTTLLAFIFSHNIPSIKLFQSQGFQRWGELPEVAAMPDQQASLTILGLKIPPSYSQ